MTQESPTGGILGRSYRLVTLGAVAIVFLIAFENLAVTTIMPVISRELHGAQLYAVAFAGPLAAAVVGQVVAGNWSDRHGPRVPMLVSVGLFAVGLILAGTATSMALIVAGRVLYGVAGGGMTVCLYVIVGRAYPDSLQPKMFGAFSAAWVIPALVGPAIAGIVSDTVGWRWVFLGVVVLIVPAMLMVVPAMRPLSGAHSETEVKWSPGRIGWSAVLAVAVLGLSLSSELPRLPGLVLAVVALCVGLVAVRPLVPRGTLRGTRGLPGVILTRGVIAAGYFGAEVYLPYLLTDRFGLTPSLAGLALTGAGVAWGATSWLQARLPALDSRMSARIGASAVVVAIAAALATSAWHLVPWVAIAGWAIGGAGMGMIEPRLAVLTLAYSTPVNRGFNSSAMSIADSVGSGMSLALLGILFGAFGATPTGPAFTATFAVTLVFALLAVAVCGRAFLRDRAGDA